MEPSKIAQVVPQIIKSLLRLILKLAGDPFEAKKNENLETSGGTLRGNHPEGTKPFSNSP